MQTEFMKWFEAQESSSAIHLEAVTRSTVTVVGRATVAITAFGGQ
ncbi:hypothetical protein [Methylocystis echinoides]|jgi:hypothetical protein|nr:hypothetical protein [Methylocystis echinoides]